MTYTTQQIAQQTNGQLEGDGDIIITGLEQLKFAQTGQLSFIGTEKYVAQWPNSNASAALIQQNLTAPVIEGKALIRVDNVDLAMAEILGAFAPPAIEPEPGIDASAVIDPTAQLGSDVCIGPNVVIGKQVQVGDGCVIHANVTLVEGAVVGDHCILWPGVVIRERCVLGNRVVCHSNVSIGADGFGYRPSPDGQGIVKIPHIGGVLIGDDVEIGANSAIDRGKFSNTTIGAGTKIDNLVQIGHNCHIGRCVVISGASGIAGTVTIGDGVTIGGMAALRDHITIGDGAMLAGGSQVMNDVPAGEIWAGSPARERRNALRIYAAFEKLPDLFKDVRKLKRKNKK